MQNLRIYFKNKILFVLFANSIYIHIVFIVTREGGHGSYTRWQRIDRCARDQQSLFFFIWFRHLIRPRAVTNQIFTSGVCNMFWVTILSKYHEGDALHYIPTHKYSEPGLTMVVLLGNKNVQLASGLIGIRCLRVMQKAFFTVDQSLG